MIFQHMKKYGERIINVYEIKTSYIVYIQKKIIHYGNIKPSESFWIAAIQQTRRT